MSSSEWVLMTGYQGPDDWCKRDGEMGFVYRTHHNSNELYTSVMNEDTLEITCPENHYLHFIKAEYKICGEEVGLTHWGTHHCDYIRVEHTLNEKLEGENSVSQEINEGFLCNSNGYTMCRKKSGHVTFTPYQTIGSDNKGVCVLYECIAGPSMPPTRYPTMSPTIPTRKPTSSPTTSPTYPDCNDHGDFQVSENRCSCENGWAGSNCEIQYHDARVAIWTPDGNADDNADDNTDDNPNDNTHDHRIPLWQPRAPQH